MLTFRQFINLFESKLSDIIKDHEILSRHYNFNKKEIENIEDYTSTGVRNIGLEKIANKQKTPKAITLYSGMSDEKASNLGIHKSKHIVFSNVQSTTLDKEVAKRFGKHILKIHHPEGSSGSYIENHSDRIVPEKEFILPKGHKIEIIKKTRENGYTIHHAITVKN